MLHLDFHSFSTPYSPSLIIWLPIFSALSTHAFTQLHEPGAFTFLSLSLAAQLAVVAWSYLVWNLSLFSAALITLKVASLFLATLFTSIATYRLAFHRLRRFPGPPSLALSEWTTSISDLRTPRFETYKKLHARYGDIVRVGPRELSINDVAAVAAIYGAAGNATVTRGPFYEAATNANGGASTLQTSISMKEHAERRREWEPAFGAKAINEYKTIIRTNADHLMEQISSHRENEALNISEFFGWFSFDTMADIGLGKPFGMLETKEIKIITDGMSLLLPMGNIPYVATILSKVPSPSATFNAWIASTLKERLDKGPLGKVKEDVISHLVRSYDGKTDMARLAGDTALLVVAGSDTTSGTMSLLVLELLDNPSHYQRLQDELDRVFPDGDVQDLDLLVKDCPYLNACISEALRLHTVVPSGLPRTTSSQGMVIPLSNGEKLHVPPNTVVSTPTWVLQRDERNFSPHPDTFYPDRWLEPEKQRAHNVKAYNPFSTGPTACIGKQVALAELRCVIAKLFRSFDVKLADGFNADDVRHSIVDCFTVQFKPVFVDVSRRAT